MPPTTKRASTLPSAEGGSSDETVEIQAPPLEEINNSSSSSGGALQVTMVREEMKTIELEMLTTFDKLLDHFYKFFTKVGKGFYADYVEVSIREVLEFNFNEWNANLDIPLTTSFSKTPREELKLFIDFYWKTIIQQEGTDRSAHDETELRKQLCAISFHCFMDKQNRRVRRQDLSKAHVQAFTTQIVMAFNACSRANEGFTFPVKEKTTYRDVLDAWINDIEFNAPVSTRAYFRSLAKEFRQTYPSQLVAFDRDNGCLGVFLEDLAKRFKVIETSIQQANLVLSTYTIQTMVMVFDFLPPSQLQDLIIGAEAAAKKLPLSLVPASQETPAISNTSTANKRPLDDKSHPPADKRQVKEKTEKGPSLCQFCGRTHKDSNTKKCSAISNKHPNANLATKDGKPVPWESSPEGLRLRTHGYYRVHNSYYVDKAGDKIQIKVRANSLHSLTFTNVSHPCPFRATIAISGETPDLGEPEHSVLLDSGASTNFIRRSLVPLAHVKMGPSTRILIANGDYIYSNNFVCISKLLIKSLITHVQVILSNINCIILDTLPEDIILGMPAIREYGFTSKFPEHWGATATLQTNSHDSEQALAQSQAQHISEDTLMDKDSIHLLESSVAHSAAPPTSDFKGWDKTAPPVNIPLITSSSTQDKDIFAPIETSVSSPRDEVQGDTHNVELGLASPPPSLDLHGLGHDANGFSAAPANLPMDDSRLSGSTAMAPSGILQIPKRVPKRAFLSDELDDDDGIPDSNNSLPTSAFTVSDKPLHERIQVEGPPSLQARIRAFLTRPDIVERFATSTSKHAAKMEPMHFEVDKTLWENPRKNRQPARRLSVEREQALKAFLDQALSDGIIVASDYPFWSQVFMVVKRNKKFRICIDYRGLNAATARKDWPIPRIDAVLQRIGSHRPKFFGVFDLTSGYYQCPISVDSQAFTTFATPFGNYKWTRLPMGPSNAPGHFQKQMSITVFWKEVHRILEVYLDDLIVWGNSEDEFMERLEITFTRLTEHNLTLNPDKCKMGVSSVEYVGHVIDEHGLRFTPEKLDAVLHFKTPATQKEMKSFLGLATYFRDHVPNFSALAAPLHSALHSYAPKQPFAWTPALETAFESLKQAVYSCDTLYFPQGEGKFVVETDASVLGIGAALFQEVETPAGMVRRPVAFMSRALSDVQKRWATIEQEAYAVYMALTTWKHFLRDVHFVLRTDHRNLTYINTNEDGKVRRWKIELQAYNFDLEWIPGDENAVADILSRQFPTETLNILSQLPIHSYHVGSIAYGNTTKDGNAHAVIAEFHCATVGHFGIEATIQRIKGRGISWPRMEEDVRAFVLRCPTCQKLSERHYPISSTHYSTSSYSPMTRLNVDAIGPFPTDTFGNAYIVVVIDTFTRFIELYKSPDATALSAARALVQHCGRYGVPEQLLTDNGPQFYNLMVESLSRFMGIQHLFTVPYSHEENGLVERANKEVSRHLRAILMDRRLIDTWSESLPLVQRIINAKVHEATGVAPAALLFGSKFDLDRVLLQSPPSDGAALPSTVHEYVVQLEQAQRVMTELAKNTQQAREDARRNAKRSKMSTEFATGSYVLMSHPEGKRPSKLHAPLLGPFKVLGQVPSSDGLTPAEYILFDSVTQTERRAGVHRLRPYHHDPSYTDPAETALTDKNAYTIESVLDHRPKTKASLFVKLPKSKLTFLVKYQGYAEPEWNTWANLRTNFHLHQYLRQSGLSSMIPKQFE